MTPSRSKSLSFLSLCLIFTLLCQTTSAQSVRGNWDEVRKTKPGSKLTIKTKTGQKHEGKVKEIMADSITLSPKGGGSGVELKREEIAEIRKKSGAHTAAYAALLGGVGFAGGYGIGYGIGEAKNARFHPLSLDTFCK